MPFWIQQDENPTSILFIYFQLTPDQYLCINNGSFLSHVKYFIQFILSSSLLHHSVVS